MSKDSLQEDAKEEAEIMPLSNQYNTTVSRSRGKTCLFASYTTGENAKDSFVMFDAKTSSTYNSRDVLCLGRMGFLRSSPRANFEAVIPKLPSVIDDETEIETKPAASCETLPGDPKAVGHNNKYNNSHNYYNYYNSSYDTKTKHFVEHELGCNWEYEAPEEEIIFGTEDTGEDIGVDDDYKDEEISLIDEEESVPEDIETSTPKKGRRRRRKVLVDILSRAFNPIMHDEEKKEDELSYHSRRSSSRSSASFVTPPIKEMTSPLPTKPVIPSKEHQTLPNEKEWLIKGFKHGTRVQKGSNELYFDVPIQVENSNDFSLATSTPGESMFLYQLMNNLGLSVELSMSKDVKADADASTNTYADDKTANTENRRGHWSVEGKTKNISVKKNLVRKLQGNGFSGGFWNRNNTYKTKKFALGNSTEDLSRKSLAYLDGCFDGLFGEDNNASRPSFMN